MTNPQLPPPPPNGGHPAEDPQAALFRDNWARRHRRQCIVQWLLFSWLIGLTLVSVIALTDLVQMPRGSFRVIFPLYFLPIFGVSVFSIVNCRCPRCNQGQNRLRNPRFCFNCGLQLRNQ